MNDHSSPAGFKWAPPKTGPEVTLADIRAFIERVVPDLDQDSRYISELLEVVNAATDLSDYLARLSDVERVRTFQQDGSLASHGERGRSWLDDDTWEQMDPFERTLSNLLTGETRMMWAADGQKDWSLVDDVLRDLGDPLDVLSVPCSTGKEPFSLAIAGLRVGLHPDVVGVDRQDAYLERARSGVLVPHHRDRELDGIDAWLKLADGRLRVAPEVRDRCRFVQGDVLVGNLPEGPFGLVSCRNLLGYFRGDSLATAFRNVSARVRPGGVLLLDPFVTGGEEMALVRELLAGGGWTRRWADASYYDAPG